MGGLRLSDKFIPVATAVFDEQEEHEIIDTLRSGWITIGPKTKAFEEGLRQYLGVRHAIALSSCSAALHLALLAIGAGPGDEVITTTFTFAATVNAILHVGAKPVLVDLEEGGFNIDLKKVQEKITKKTKAIIPVHYGGVPVNQDLLMKIAKKNKIKVIEDAAHAIGAKYNGELIGIHGDIVCFSFHPVKNMTTGDGGAVVTNDDDIAEKVRRLSVNGMSKDAWKRLSKEGSWDYAVVDTGFKYHMNDLSASLGIHQLKKLDSFIEYRAEIASLYVQEFRGEELLSLRGDVDRGVKPSHNLFPVLVDTDKLSVSRNQLMELLKEQNIGSVVYYRPVHMQPHYQSLLGIKVGDFPNAERVFDRLICLPIYPGMTLQDVIYVAYAFKSTVDKYKSSANLS